MTRLRTISRLTLGTVQLGMRYGVVNTVGDPGVDGAHSVLDAAWKANISCIDTARVYGEAEARIGEWSASRGYAPVLISKLPNLSNAKDPAEIEAIFMQSAAALRTKHIDGYLCHSPANLSDRIVRSGLDHLLAQDRISCFGVTLYSETELEAALAVPGLGIVQLPISLANPRFARNIAETAERGILVFARSVYLQGVLLTPPDHLPTWLSMLADPLRRLRNLANEIGVDVPTLALAAVDSIPGIHSIVIGAETPQQLAQSVTALRSASLHPAVIEEAWSLFKNVPAELSDPSHWPAR